MTQKRKAHQAFGRPVSAFAAAKLAQYGPPTAPGAETGVSEQAGEFAASVGAVPYNGHHSVEFVSREASEDDYGHAIPTTLARAQTDLSTFVPTPENSTVHSDEELQFRLPWTKSVILLGEYDLQVLAGSITLYGAILHASEKVYQIYAPSTHALPTLIARRTDAEVVLRSPRRSMRALSKLSPPYRKVWAYSKRKPAFVPVAHSHSDPLKRLLTALETDDGAEKIISRIMNEGLAGGPTVLIAGPKSSGKSTFARLLVNSLLTARQAGSCYYLDIDPGQPEFSPPGFVSLVELTAPVFGPPFTHPLTNNLQPNRIIRQHAIAATNFRDDPEHYVSCIVDLYKRYQTLKAEQQQTALVINSCGWVTDVGARVLVDFASAAKFTDIVAAAGMDESLTEALASNRNYNIRPVLHRLLKKPSIPAPRTPAELRTMQSLAYFHKRHTTERATTWNGNAISTFKPWQVAYDGPESAIYAIMSYGQAPQPDFLAEVLDGSLVAITVIDDDGAFAQRQSAVDEPGAVKKLEEERVHYSIDDSIQRTPERLPFVVPHLSGSSHTIDPRHSHCVALALVRAIDTERRRLHLVTPLDDGTIAELESEKIVLIRGGFDAAEWAFLEDLRNADVGTDISVGPRARPWVSKRDLVGIEGAVWRLRHPPIQSAPR